MKLRKRNKLYTATAIFLSAPFLLTGCGADTTDDAPIIDFNTAREETSTNKTFNTDSEKETARNEENQEKNTADTTIYDNILSEYRDMVQNDFYENLRDSDTYESSFGEHIGLEIRTHEQDIYYALYDIDQNGTDELIIAGGENAVSNPDFSPWNYDLYGYDGTKAVHIFPEMEFGYRTNFSLYENGVIEVSYSGSAAESGTDFYKIGNDGFTPELVDSFSAVAHLEREHPVFTYYQKKDEIPKEEYETGIQSYEVPLATALNWLQIQ